MRIRNARLLDIAGHLSWLMFGFAVLQFAVAARWTWIDAATEVLRIALAAWLVAATWRSRSFEGRLGKMVGVAVLALVPWHAVMETAARGLALVA